MLERIDMLKLLYPWYKNEVYHRRQQMIWLVSATASMLLVVLFLVPALPPPLPAHRSWDVVVVIGLLLFSGSMMYFVRQQRIRHQMAKGVLIKLEQGLGLYEEGRYLDDRSLYPKNWETLWLRDRSEFIYHGIIVSLTALVVLALLLR